MSSALSTVKPVPTPSSTSLKKPIRQVDTEETWPSAADFKLRYSPALGDAFALATANQVSGMLLVGADDDYDDVDDVPITRFRPESA